MGLTAWKALKSNGEIADTPASCFQYRIAEDVEVYLGDEEWTGGFVTRNLNDRWIIHIYDHDVRHAFHEEREAALLFRQVVTLDLWVVALVTDLNGIPLASLFTWWVNYATIETTHFAGRELPVTTLATDCDARQDTLTLTSTVGFPTSGSVYIGAVDSSGNYTGIPERVDYSGLDGNELVQCVRGRLGRTAAAHSAGAKVMEAMPLALGVDDAIPVPGGGADFTDQYGIILFDWESPVYAMALPEGACVEFAGHWLGRASLGLNLDIIQTRVCAGDTFAALYMPETGYWWIADTSGSDGVRLTLAADLRAAGVQCSADVAAPQSGLDWAGAQKAFDGSSATASSCTNPILLRPPRSVRVQIIYTKAQGSYLEGSDGDNWEEPVELTSKPIVAACYDPAGTLYAVCVSGGATTVLRRAQGPVDAVDWYGPVEGDEVAAVVVAADGTQTPLTVPARLSVLTSARPGHLRLLTVEGRSYETFDGGSTWRA
jgi:hypothetical protein